MLDTNIVSHLMKNPAGRVAARLRDAGEAGICVSIITACELRYGASRAAAQHWVARVEGVLKRIAIAGFEPPADQEYGAIRMQLEAAGTPIGANDMLIAAHAKALGVTLVTANTGEFRRVNGLNIVNWLEEAAP